jgi:hypothetical protein
METNLKIHKKINTIKEEIELREYRPRFLWWFGKSHTSKLRECVSRFLWWFEKSHTLLFEP